MGVVGGDEKGGLAEVVGFDGGADAAAVFY